MSAAGGVDQLQARLQGLASAIRAELAQEIQTQAASLADRARALAGGTLDDAITAGPDGLRAEIGSDLPYARLMELGFQGSESVKAYLREIRQVFGRPVTPHPIAVGAFQRIVDRPGRPYLAPALAAADLPDGFVAAIGRAIGS